MLKLFLFTPDHPYTWGAVVIAADSMERAVMIHTNHFGHRKWKWFPPQELNITEPGVVVEKVVRAMTTGLRVWGVET